MGMGVERTIKLKSRKDEAKLTLRTAVIVFSSPNFLFLLEFAYFLSSEAAFHAALLPHAVTVLVFSSVCVEMTCL